MSEMHRRVATAICLKSECGGEGMPIGDDCSWCLSLAQAAIHSMRDATRPMIVKGLNTPTIPTVTKWMEGAWRAMCDEALTPESDAAQPASRSSLSEGPCPTTPDGTRT